VIFLIEQICQTEDPVFQDLLQRAQSATLIKDNVATLNSCIIKNRVTNGEILPKKAIIWLNCIRKEANLVYPHAPASSISKSSQTYIKLLLPPIIDN